MAFFREKQDNDTAPTSNVALDIQTQPTSQDANATSNISIASSTGVLTNNVSQSGVSPSVPSSASATAPIQTQAESVAEASAETNAEAIATSAPSSEDLPKIVDAYSEELLNKSVEPDLSSSRGLESIRSKAISQLKGLVAQSDQLPEDKFKTIMNLIRLTDDTTLIAQAYESAQNIPDNNLKTDALLEVIKEIDFLTKR